MGRNISKILKSFYISENAVSSEYHPENIPDYLLMLLPQKFFKILGIKPDITFKNRYDSPYYHTVKNKIYLTKGYDYYNKVYYIHEMGHYFHYNTGLITDDHIDPAFQEVLHSFKSEFKQIPLCIRKKMKDYNIGGMHQMSNRKHRFLLEYIAKYFDLAPEEKDTKSGVFCDMIENITQGKYGMGHGRNYYRGEHNTTTAHCELFAHSLCIYFMGNEIVEYYFPKSVKLIKKYFNKILKLKKR